MALEVTGIGDSAMLEAIRLKIESGQPVPIQEVLMSDHTEAKEAIGSMLADIKSGMGSLCACMGPMYGEPHCPCQMHRLGLPMDGPIRKAAEAESKKEWDKSFVRGGFFYELNRKADKNAN